MRPPRPRAGDLFRATAILLAIAGTWSCAGSTDVDTGTGGAGPSGSAGTSGAAGTTGAGGIGAGAATGQGGVSAPTGQAGTAAPDTVIPAIGLARGTGPLLSPAVLEGRPPGNSSEIVLGTSAG